MPLVCLVSYTVRATVQSDPFYCCQTTPQGCDAKEAKPSADWFSDPSIKETVRCPFIRDWSGSQTRITDPATCTEAEVSPQGNVLRFVFQTELALSTSVSNGSEIREFQFSSRGAEIRE